MKLYPEEEFPDEYSDDEQELPIEEVLTEQLMLLHARHPKEIIRLICSEAAQYLRKDIRRAVRVISEFDQKMTPVGIAKEIPSRLFFYLVVYLISLDLPIFPTVLPFLHLLGNYFKFKNFCREIVKANEFFTARGMEPIFSIVGDWSYYAVIVDNAWKPIIDLAANVSDVFDEKDILIHQLKRSLEE